MGAKPDDIFVLPMCDSCHISGEKAQHGHGERYYWRYMIGIDPILVAFALDHFRRTDDPERAALCIERHTAKIKRLAA